MNRKDLKDLKGHSYLRGLAGLCDPDGLIMEFFDVVNNRKSVRAYAARPVEDEKVNAILNAANQAPSAGNLQAYEMAATDID